MEQIKQIIPADGWSAVFAFRNENSGIDLHVEPLIAWGFIEVNDEQDLTGYTREGTTWAPAKDRDFIGYLAPGESAERYREDAEKHLRRQAEREAKRAQLQAAGFRYGTSRGVARWLSQKEALAQLGEISVA